MPEGFNKFIMEQLKTIRLVEDALTGDHVVSHVYETREYSKFVTFKENRTPDHVGRIAGNMIEYGAIQKPIVVTTHPDYPDKLVAVDGWNSFNARVQLGLPIPYIVLDKATQREMTALNLVSKNWNSRNYVDLYASLGYPDYLIFQNLLNEYEFTCRSMEYILRLSTTEDRNSRTSHHTLQRGLFKCKDPLRSREIINFLLKVKEIEGGRSSVFKADKFVAAIVRLFNYKGFDPVRALKKMALIPSKIVKQADATGYLSMIEEIYNYRVQKNDLVSFMSIKF